MSVSNTGVNVLQSRGGGDGGDTDSSVPDPDAWACEDPSKRVRVEVRANGVWYEVPVVSAELTGSSQKLSHIQRTAKVKVPERWRGERVTDVVTGFNQSTSGGYSLCRVFFRNTANAPWVISHFGYVSAVGPASEDGVIKFWVYDVADLLQAINVTETYREPAVQSVLKDVTERINAATPFDVRARVVGELAKSVIQDSDLDYEFSKLNPQIGDAIVNIAADTVVRTVDNLLESTKRFQRNRDTLVDVLDWLTDKTNTRWWFEPTADGPILVLDADNTSTVHADSSVRGVDDTVAEPYELVVENVIRVIENSALNDMSPVNAVTVRGEAHGSPTGTGIGTVQTVTGITEQLGGPSVVAKRYAEATAQYDPLVDRADGQLYTGPVQEVESITLEDAEREATSILKESINNVSEGSISSFGDIYVQPHDTIVAYPRCGQLVDTSDVPLAYEVTNVKHVKKSTEQFVTEVQVSLLLSDDLITTSSSLNDITEPEGN